MHYEHFKLCTEGLEQGKTRLLYHKRLIADPNRVYRGRDFVAQVCLSSRIIFYFTGPPLSLLSRQRGWILHVLIRWQMLVNRLCHTRIKEATSTAEHEVGQDTLP